MDFHLSQSIREFGAIQGAEVNISKGVGILARIPLSSAGGKGSVLPEGKYLASLVWTSASQEHRSAAMDLVVSPNSTTVLEFVVEE